MHIEKPFIVESFVHLVVLTAGLGVALEDIQKVLVAHVGVLVYLQLLVKGVEQVANNDLFRLGTGVR